MMYLSQNETNSIIAKVLDSGHVVVLEQGIHDEWATAAASPDLVPFTPPEPSVPTKAQIDALRKAAYQDEADPLFFKWQRGESTQQEWFDKIADIRNRYPDVIS